ncbi:MAG: alkaline phosphatase, partial [Puniceicoccales bacterium]
MRFSCILLPLLAIASPLLGGSAIFIHPDGTGLGHWNAARLLLVGPDGMTNWDQLDVLSAYRPHQKNWLSTTSHAGATVHAYGKKVHYD